MPLVRGSIRSLVEVVFLASVVAGCSGSMRRSGWPTGGGGEAGDDGTSATGGAGAGGTGGRATGGSGGTVPVARDASPGAKPDASIGTPDDGSTDPDAGSDDGGTSIGSDGGGTPMGSDGGTQPGYKGEIPIYYGPEVGPIVKMNCPDDPTQGWTEYKESFHVERPYDVPINTRFSIIGGIYSFWVFPTDKALNMTSTTNPRTEAAYGGTFERANGGTNRFTTGMRLYSADMLIESNAVGSAIMQIHTDASGGGPIGVRIMGADMINNGTLTVVKGSTVPGGLVDSWFNYKASLDTATLEVKIYINNCLKSTYTGAGGDGNFYFKNGVYFCKTSATGCFSHYKNIHLYKK